MSELREPNNEQVDAHELVEKLNDALTVFDLRVQLIHRQWERGVKLPEWLMEALDPMEDALARLRMVMERFARDTRQASSDYR